MSKGELTRMTILERAAQMASTLGLEGLSIGKLADELDLSKSGVFAHFQSKEALQAQVLQFSRDRFVEIVIAPALKQPRGEPRVRALLDNWIGWGKSTWLPGGCIFVPSAAELDDAPPGPARDVLVQAQRDWLDTLAHAARIAIQTGDFRKDLDPDQFAFEVHALYLGFHHRMRLMREAGAEKRIRTAFERLLRDARKD